MKNLALALAVAALAAGCNKKPPAPPAEVAKPPEPVKPVAPPTPAKPARAPDLTAPQKAARDAAFAAARELVKQGLKYKAEGEAIEKAQGRQAANDTLVKAKHAFVKACADTEDWIEPELGKVTQAQVDEYLTSYANERARWQKYIAELGKLHTD